MKMKRRRNMIDGADLHQYRKHAQTATLNIGSTICSNARRPTEL